jgi:hypothetical protein
MIPTVLQADLPSLARLTSKRRQQRPKMATGLRSVKQAKHEDIVKVGTRFLNTYYMSNTFTGNQSMILDSSTKCDSNSDIDYKL